MLPKTQYGFFMLFFIPINRKKSILVGPGAWREPVEPAWKLEREGGRQGEVGVLLDIKPGTVREWKRRYMWDGPARKI